MSLSQFFQTLGSIAASSTQKGTGEALARLLSVDISLDETAQTVSSLQAELQAHDNDSIANLVQSENLFDGDWPAFGGLVESYLKLCRDIDPSSVLKSNDLLLVFFNDLTVSVMNNNFGNHLAKLLHHTTNYVFPLIRRLDLILNEHIKGKKFQRLIFLSTCLSKLFNHLRSLKGWNEKKSLILFIVNRLNKIYFIIDNPLLCANIFSNMNLLNLNFQNFPKLQQCEYRFILGKFYLIKHKLFKSYYHLNWVYTHLHQADEKNRLKVLRFLIPMSLLVGRIPSKHLISQYNEFHSTYKPSIIDLINGNYLGFQSSLFENQAYFQSHDLLIILSTKSKLIIFKNLLANILKTNISLSPNDPNAFKIPYSSISLALLKSIGTNEQQDHLFGTHHMFKFPIPESPQAQAFFVENVCISVIENDLMKGNILSKIQILILSKKTPLPPVFELYQDKYGVSYDEKWMDL
jgi:hypothetical protein